MLKSLRLAIDLDEVCAQWTPAFAEYLKRVCRADVPEHTNWNYWEELGISKQEYDHLLREFIMEDGLKRIQPTDGALEGLSRLYQAGHKLHIVTARGVGMDRIATNAVRKGTADWILGRGFPPHDLTFTGDKTSVNADVIFDDNLETLQAWSRISLREEGRVVAVCFDRPWNRNYVGPRVSYFEGFEKIVEELAHS